MNPPLAPHARRWRSLPLRALRVLRTRGPREFVSRSAAALRRLLFPPTYQRWISLYDTLTEPARAGIRADITRWGARPLISVLMPVEPVQPVQLRAAVRSLQKQLYSNWELCLASGARTSDDVGREARGQAQEERRLRAAFSDGSGSVGDNANRALALASGEYVALMAADAELAEQALYRVAKEVTAHPDADLIFSDEDQIDGSGKRHEPWFKPDWNPALMLSRNGFCNLGIYRRSLIEKVGGFRADFDGSHDHDLVLRCARETRPERIRHIPHILYHRRVVDAPAADVSERSNAWDTGRRVIEEHLVASGVRATAGGAGKQSYQVEYALPSPPPRVSILMPSTCEARLLEP